VLTWRADSLIDFVRRNERKFILKARDFYLSEVLILSFPLGIITVPNIKNNVSL
jgi:hypothetical protein